MPINNLLLIKNATIVNENKTFVGSVLIDGEFIAEIFEGEDNFGKYADYRNSLDAKGLLLMAGAIDDQVHFRDPGLTHKGDIATESRAAVAGGVTSFMDMPNTKPQTVTVEALERKYELAAEKSFANFSFYMGATNENIAELRKLHKGQ
ncbi:MAG: amidohydrolase family protein, partial [Prevotellaceae bacterium]|nr:amidohydrolase family protein [Prevotellaceae bacterium]